MKRSGVSIKNVAKRGENPFITQICLRCYNFTLEAIGDADELAWVSQFNI